MSIQSTASLGTVRRDVGRIPLPVVAVQEQRFESQHARITLLRMKLPSDVGPRSVKLSMLGRQLGGKVRRP